MISKWRCSSGEAGGALVDDLGDAVGQRAVDDVGVAGDPADVGGAPVHVGLGFDVEHVVVGVGDLGQVAAGGVHDALGLAGGARGVEQEQRMLGVERLRGVLGRRAVDRRRATTGRGPRSTRRRFRCGAPPVRARCVGCAVRRASSTASFSDAALPRRHCPSVVITSLASASSTRGPQRGGGEAGEDHRMHHAEAGARQHRHDRLGHHRHVDRHPVAGDQAEFGEVVGGLADLVLELRVGQRAAVADRLALPVDRDPIAVALLDVAVHAVVGDVELAADEPLRDRCAGPVQHLVERRLPGQPLGLSAPERQPVRVGLVVQLGRRVRLVRRNHRMADRRTGFLGALRPYV